MKNLLDTLYLSFISTYYYWFADQYKKSGYEISVSTMDGWFGNKQLDAMTETIIVAESKLGVNLDLRFENKLHGEEINGDVVRGDLLIISKFNNHVFGAWSPDTTSNMKLLGLATPEMDKLLNLIWQECHNEINNREPLF